MKKFIYLKNYLPKTLIFLILIFFLFPSIGEGIEIPNPLRHRTLEGLINALVNFVFWVTMALAPLMIIIGGFYFVTALGDPKKIETGKNIIIWTVTAIIVVLLARGLIALLRNILGG